MWKFRFILEKCDGVLVVENKKKKVMIDELKKKSYDPDPVKAWKIRQNRDEALVSVCCWILGRMLEVFENWSFRV
jgi:DNA topoisomerase-2